MLFQPVISSIDCSTIYSYFQQIKIFESRSKLISSRQNREPRFILKMEHVELESRCKKDRWNFSMGQKIYFENISRRKTIASVFAFSSFTKRSVRLEERLTSNE